MQILTRSYQLLVERFTVFEFGAKHEKKGCGKKLASLLVLLLEKTRNWIVSHLCDKQMVETSSLLGVLALAKKD